ncbi:MAG: DinB family protein [Hymenobacteraceae bacterium]|nr:DinB family protein [Hymenobacteraceae bacterium]
MPIGQELLQELELEAAVTRRYLERIPFDQLAYKPAKKSASLGRLAVHVAEIIAWWKVCIEADKLDFLSFEPKAVNSPAALMAYFDHLLAETTAALATVPDGAFEQPWSMTHGTDLLFQLPKKQVVRLFCMNYLVHHRAQLGVYLRLLDIPVPAIYGPSADDKYILLITPFF